VSWPGAYQAQPLTPCSAPFDIGGNLVAEVAIRRRAEPVCMRSYAQTRRPTDAPDLPMPGRHRKS